MHDETFYTMHCSLKTMPTSFTPGKLFDNLPGGDSGVNVIIANPEWSVDSTLQNF